MGTLRCMRWKEDENVTPKVMTDEHKGKMADGRRQARIVENYLRHLEQRPKAQKRPSLEAISAELDEVESQLASATGVRRLTLLQERENLQRMALEAQPEDDGALEEQFVAVARGYGDRKGISYSTWREFGVPKEVLQAAAIPRTRRPNRAAS